MDLLLFAARAVVAAIFLLAGISKLFDREGTREAIENFGVPAALAPAGSLLLPVAELVTTAALIPRVTAWWGALAALILLLAFCVGIGANLMRGKTPDCHCFGQIHSEPIGPSTLIRNVAFAVPAAFVVLHGPGNPGLDPFGEFTAMSSRDQLVTVVIVASLLVLLFLLRVTAVLLEESPHSMWELLVHGHHGDHAAASGAQAPGQGLPIASGAPTFRLPSAVGGVETLETLRARGRPVMLIFSSTNCPICTELMPDIGKWQRELDEYVTLAVIEEGDEAPIREEAARYGVSNVLVQKGNEVYSAYNANGTPSGVIVQVDGTIGSASASGSDQVHGLLAQTLGLMMLSSLGLVPAPSLAASGSRSIPAPLTVGDELPGHSLTDMSGESVSLKDLGRNSVYLLLWDANSGACRELEAGVLDLESQGVPLAILLPATQSQNQVVRFRSRILIDRGDAVRTMLGMREVPAAVLMGDGRVQTPVAEGPAAVRHLLSPVRTGLLHGAATPRE